MHNNYINLSGLGVLVTRPAHQARNLCNLIITHGGRPLAFPVLEISPVLDPTTAIALLMQTWDAVIYTSTNAVRFSTALYQQIPTGIKPNKFAQLIAIGTATAQALTQVFGDIPVLVPEHQNSEGLLELPVLIQSTAKRVLIVRGEGGRSLLSESLISRKALVSIAEVYRRNLPSVDIKPLLTNWTRDVQVVVTTSGESLDNLILLLGPNERYKLVDTPVVTVSKRLQHLATATGINLVICAAGSDDNSILIALGDVAQQFYS